MTDNSTPNPASRTDVVAEAQTWLSTPYQHQQALKGLDGGVDCAGLIIAVGKSLGLIDLVNWSRFANYSQRPNPTKMRSALELYMDEITNRYHDAQVGDVVWVHWREGLPMHLAILMPSSVPGVTFDMIHAYAEVGRVVRHSYTKEWWTRTDSYWRYRNLKD